MVTDTGWTTGRSPRSISPARFLLLQAGLNAPGSGVGEYGHRKRRTLFSFEQGDFHIVRPARSGLQ